MAAITLRLIPPLLPAGFTGAEEHSSQCQKTNSFLSLLLLSIGLVAVIPFGHAQESATFNHTHKWDQVDSTAELLKKYEDVSAVPLPKRRNSYSGFSVTEKSNLWKLHLALYLVKRPELNQEQKQIVLDAITLASTEFFETTPNETARKTKVDEPRQLLTRRALSAFPKNDAADVFANVGGGKAEGDLLRKYQDMSALPMQKRRALFRKVSAKDRSDLWKTHLALSLVNRPELNEGQKEIILSAMSLATPEWLEVHSDNPAWKAKVVELRLLENRILTVFTKEEGAQIFATLGDKEPDVSVLNQGGSVELKSANSMQLGRSSRYSARTVNRFAAQDMELVGSCSCSRESDWCWNYCGGGGCDYTSSGCGTLFQYSCVGVCH